MIPIEQLLHRIQYDPELKGGAFTIGYCDHVLRSIVQVPFEQVHLTRGHHFSFDVRDTDGEIRQIPFHRVREVWRDGELIWQRPEP
jgi:uncharacterized protein (UPF0248 family)